MYEKLNKIYDLTYSGEYVGVTLNDGRFIICRADFFGEDEDDTGETISDLRVIKEDGTSEILDEADVVEIEALTK